MIADIIAILFGGSKGNGRGRSGSGSERHTGVPRRLCLEPMIIIIILLQLPKAASSARGVAAIFYHHQRLRQIHQMQAGKDEDFHEQEQRRHGH